MADIEDALTRDRLNALAWLAAAQLLEIRLALRLDPQGRYSRGLFHAKTGIFRDDAGNQVSFNGSANETAGGLVENFEHIDVFRSWQDPEGRVRAASDDFESLWTNRAPGLEVIDFSEAGRELLERYRNVDEPPLGLKIDEIREPKPGGVLRPPVGLELRPYQRDAIRAWSKAGGRGVFAMAAGTGKTLTALVLGSKVAEKNRPLASLPNARVQQPSVSEDALDHHEVGLDLVADALHHTSYDRDCDVMAVFNDRTFARRACRLNLSPRLRVLE